ncbi:VanZ family protein [Paenibacillus sp. NPDC056579]|uniref:VanZ family protein n=1 Tax=Paenibacillus sp. NPDC056579 TaxID=3345871 RepID=UPI00368FF8F8
MSKTSRKRTFWRFVLVPLSLVIMYIFGAYQIFTGEHTRIIIQQLTGLNEVHSYALNAMVRKTAHILAYGIIGICFYTLFRQKTIMYAWCCTTLVAVLDEWHQSFVPGRSPLVRDIVLDAAAALVFLWGFTLWNRRKS